MELLIGGGIAASIIYTAARWKDKDQKKIQHVFKNVGYKVKDREPKLIKTDRSETHTNYIFSVPYGLIDDPKLQPIIEKTLCKPVTILFKGKLIVRVYNHSLPKNAPYDSFKPIGGWNIPIGITQDETLYHDFDKIPHMTVAGATRWGKTVFLKSLVTHLIENNPDDVEIYALDLKGGLAFHRYKNLKQFKCVAGDHKESAEALSLVLKDIKSTMANFKDNYYENIVDTNIKTRKFIIVDEAAELVPIKSMDSTTKEYAQQCQQAFSHIARVSGGLGYRLIFGTQYPTSDVLDRSIKANSSSKISFRLETQVQSRVAIDENGAEDLEYPGRAIYKTVDKHMVQTPFITNVDMWEKLRRYEVNEVNSTTETAPARRKNIIKFG